MPRTTTRAVARRKHRVSGVDDSFLISKITVPATPKWMVPRKRIGELIGVGAGGPLTIVTGPPGAGKTVALASWAAARPRQGPIAWVTLDRFDNRPEIFWSYVVEAIRRAGVDLAPDFPASPTKQPDLFLHQIASALAVQDPPVLLVLDDIHLLTEPGSLDGLAYVLRNASAGLHVLVASRMDPLLPLHRYRLAGELTEIRAEELAFTEAEAGLLMAQHDVTLPPECLQLLARREEGWAAGLRLAAMSMSGHPDPEQFVKELDAEDGAIASYLIDEVLNCQPGAVRDLLLKTSILDRVSVGLAAEMTGDPTAAEAIPELARANAFVEPLGHGWYRYHSLFADILRLKLRHQSPGEVAELHHRAARWLQHNGTLREAVGQAAAAGDWPLAARMTVDEFAVGPLINAQANEALADAFAPLRTGPETVDPPVLAVAGAMALRAGRHDTGRALLGRAEGLLTGLPAGEDVPARLACALIALALARRGGDHDAAATAAASAAALLEALPAAALARNPGVRGQVLAGQAAVDMWAGLFGTATAALERSAAATRDPCEWAYAIGCQALVAAIGGKLGQAEKLARTAAAPPWNGRARTAWHPSAAAEVALAWADLERNRLGDAHVRLTQAQEALRAQPDRLVGGLAWLVSARHSLAKGSAGAAAEMIARARQGWSPPSWLDQRLALAATQAHAAAGDARAALEEAGRAGPPSSALGGLARARALLAADDLPAATGAMAGISPASAGEMPECLQLEARLLEAELGYRGGRPGQGRQALLRALKLTEADRLLLPVVLGWAWIKPVLRRDPDLAEACRALFAPAPGRAGAPQQRASKVAPVIVEQLSGRELEVLQLVSKMLTTAEIAEEMYLSVNTVKSHLKSIFRKLGTSHRGEAVRLAQRMALM